MRPACFFQHTKNSLKYHFICTLITPRCTSLSLLQTLLYILNLKPLLSIAFPLDKLEQTAPRIIEN